MKRPVALVLLLLAMTTPAFAGEFVVIVNKANPASVDKVTIARIYTGSLNSWADGTRVVAVDLPDDSPTRASFCTEMLGKTLANIKTIWAQLIFSGTALPPKQAASDDEVKKLVSADKGGVGYIKAASVDDSVKVALK